MKEEDLLKEAQEIDKELKEGKIKIRDTKTPLIYVIIPFLILLMILMIIPYYSIKLNPEPKNIPGLDIIPENIELIDLGNISYRNYNNYLTPNDPVIKQLADKIVTSSCRENKICYAKALYYFVRDNFNYVSDPLAFEYVKTPRESLITKAGDCEDGSILLANLERAVGINTKFIFIPGHVYIQIYLPEAPKKYSKDGWINLDSTCKNCEFGESGYRNI